MTATAFSAQKHARPLAAMTAYRKRLAAPLLFTLAIAYLLFHALNGERGIYAYLKQSRNLEASRIELAELTRQRAGLEQRVHALNSNSLDLDLLDEEARRLLGTAGKNEVVVLTSPR